MKKHFFSEFPRPRPKYMGAKYDRPFITHVNDSNGVWGKKVNKAENVTLNHKYLKIEEDILDTWNVFSLIALRFVNTSNNLEWNLRTVYSERIAIV